VKSYTAAIVILTFLIGTYNISNEIVTTQEDLQQGLIIHEQFLYDYHLCGLFVESTAYNVLKSRASEFKGIEYLPIPWFHVSQSKKYNWDEIHAYADSLRQLKLNNAFTVCLSFLSSGIDDYVLDILDSIGVRCIFTPDVSVGKMGYKRINFEPLPHYAIKQVNPAKIKDILYSFIGVTMCHPIRQELFMMEHPQNTILISNEEYGHFAPEGVYEDVLARSRFSLCPRGINVGSVRFWESLCAGAIPILLSDDQVLPYGFDWSSCIIRVKERDIQSIPNIIKSISLQQEESMRQACYEAYQAFSGRNFISPIIRYYALNKEH
jgi:hypothetical protein